MTTYTRTDGAQVTSYNTKETAEFIRKALKAAFPGVTFSVRTRYASQFSATYVRWTDGPTSAEVERITDRFTSMGFDGQTDSRTFHDQIVDGQAVEYSGWVNVQRDFTAEFRALAERRAAVLGIDNVWMIMNEMRPNGIRVMVKQ